MLKKIPTAISPELMKVLMEMGHGGEIMISDGNCGAEKFGTARPIVVRMDGMRVPEILEAVDRLRQELELPNQGMSMGGM